MKSDIPAQLIKAATSKFNETWLKEKVRLQGIWDKWSADVYPLVDKMGCYQIHHPYIIAKNKFYKDLLGAEPAWLSQGKYLIYRDIDNFLCDCECEGFSAAADDRQQDYINYLTSAMLNAVAKHVEDVFVEAKDIRLYDSPKGFELSAILWCPSKTATIYTSCIGAGGYNVQRYHFRYITKIK